MQKLVDWLDRVLIVLAGIALIAMMLSTAASAIGRYFFNKPLPDDVAINEMLIVLVVFLPLAYVQKIRQHISVTMFTDRMRPNNIRRLEYFGIFIGILFYTVFFASSFQAAMKVYEIGEYAVGVFNIPLWPAHFAFVLGIFLLWLRLIVEFVSGVFMPAKTENQGVN